MLSKVRYSGSHKVMGPNEIHNSICKRLCLTCKSIISPDPAYHSKVPGSVIVYLYDVNLKLPSHQKKKKWNKAAPDSRGPLYDSVFKRRFYWIDGEIKIRTMLVQKNYPYKNIIIFETFSFSLKHHHHPSRQSSSSPIEHRHQNM